MNQDKFTNKKLYISHCKNNCNKKKSIKKIIYFNYKNVILIIFYFMSNFSIDVFKVYKKKNLQLYKYKKIKQKI